MKMTPDQKEKYWEDFLIKWDYQCKNSSFLNKDTGQAHKRKYDFIVTDGPDEEGYIIACDLNTGLDHKFIPNKIPQVGSTWR